MIFTMPVIKRRPHRTLHTTIPSANNSVRQILHHVDRCHLNFTAPNLPQPPPRRNVFFDRVRVPRCFSETCRPVDAGPHKPEARTMWCPPCILLVSVTRFP